MSPQAAGRRRQGHAASSAPLATLLFFLTPFFTAVAPRLAPFMLPLLAIALIGMALRRGMDWRELIAPSHALVALVAFALYAMLSAVWAANPGGAFAKSLLFLAATLVVFASMTAFAKLQAHEAERAARVFIAGSLCGAIFVLVELLTQGALTRFAMNWMPAFKPDRAKHVAISEGWVRRISVSEFNQHVAMLTLQLWAGLLALTAIEAGRRRAILMLLYFCTLAVPIFISQHESSQIAVVIGLFVLALAWKWPRQIVAGVALCWVLGFILVLPLDFLAFRTAELHQARWLPTSARARIIIWEYTAAQVLERPLTGIGADSTARVKARRTTPEEQPKGFVYKRTTGQHAHNVFLQTWYELGIVGAVLFAIAGAAIAFRIRLLPRLAQPFAAAAFMAFATIAALAWGIWQVWLVCAVALVPFYLALAASTARER
jgi:O-antigen ligase